MSDKQAFDITAFLSVVVLCSLIGFTIFNERKYEQTEVSIERVLVKGSNFNPPKHVYVDLTEVKTGRVYKHQYVSKHFNGWRTIDFNKPFYVTKRVMRYVRIDRANEIEFGGIREGLESTQ